MVRHPGGLDVLYQGLELFQVAHIRFFTAADVERQAMKYNRIVLADLVENGARPSAGRQIVFGDQLEPVHSGPVFEHIVDMRAAQTYTKAQAVHCNPRPVRPQSELRTLPPSFSQRALDSSALPE